MGNLELYNNVLTSSIVVPSILENSSSAKRGMIPVLSASPMILQKSKCNLFLKIFKN